MKRLKIWLDDVRPEPSNRYLPFKKAEGLLSFIEEVLEGDLSKVEVFDLDHDLGDGMNGYEFIKAIISRVLDGRIVHADSPRWVIHSSNPVGAKNMEAAIRELVSLSKEEV